MSVKRKPEAGKRSPAPGWKPKRGSLGPMSGLQPMRLMWSASSTSWPDAVAFGDAAGRVGQHHGTQPERAQHAHGKCDLMRRVALVKMHAALHHDDRHSAEKAGNDAPGMAFDC